MTKKVTFSGMGCAISVVILLMTNIFPFNTAFLLCAASAIFPIIKIKCGTGYSWAAVFVSAVLSFILLAEKIYVFTFSFLAIYSVLKGLIEKLDCAWVEWLIKIAAYFAGAFIVLKIFIPAMLWQGIFAGVVIFVIYDIMISIFVTFARRKFKI